MGSVTIRNIEDAVKKGAKLVAAANGRSLEAELRDLLRRTYAGAGNERVARLRAMTGKEAVAHLIDLAGGVGLDIPGRRHEDIEFQEL
ncbi:plasmid stabilization protein [uncultured Sphingomonas sp.]|uniref:FitA-like ribbon-helix-helix domain-containing protein n=1 Tax=uncultured Sphingomonas sp. TaxID=158754 RepID=UPI0035CB1390